MNAPAGLQKFLEEKYSPENVHFVGISNSVARYQIRSAGVWNNVQFRKE
jgi:hypothetical protein